MVGSSILPIAFHKNQLFFLFGKENSMEDSAKGFSDFGGGVDKGESIYQTAMREGGEELTGFLGDGKEVKKLIRKNGGFYKINHNDQYHIHAFAIEYDENLPKYYNNNHRFLWERMNKNVLNDTKLFEKIKIEWFTVEMMKKRRNEFRGFYREIIDRIIDEVSNIKRFVKRKRKTIKRTLKRKGYSKTIKK